MITFIEYLNEAEKAFNIKKEFDKFNKELFNNELPTIKLRTTKTLKDGYLGWVMTYVETDEDGNVTHFKHKELAISTQYNNESTQGLLIHEMVHLWMVENGMHEHYNVEYHGKEFLSKVKEIQKKTKIIIPTDETNIGWFEKAEKRELKDNTKEYGIIVQHLKSFDVYMIFVTNVDILKKSTNDLITNFKRKMTSDDTEIYIGTSSHSELTKFKKHRNTRKMSWEETSKEVLDTMNKLHTITYDENYDPYENFYT